MGKIAVIIIRLKKLFVFFLLNFTFFSDRKTFYTLKATHTHLIMWITISITKSKYFRQLMVDFVYKFYTKNDVWWKAKEQLKKSMVKITLKSLKKHFFTILLNTIINLRWYEKKVTCKTYNIPLTFFSNLYEEYLTYCYSFIIRFEIENEIYIL